MMFDGASPQSSKESVASPRAGEDQSQLDFDIAFFGSVLQRQADYVDVLRCQAELLTRKGLRAEALELDRRLAALRPDDCVVSYNLACSLALTGQRRDALKTLRRALEAGYDDFEYLHLDSDLDALRELPAYKALLREFAPRVSRS